MIDLNGQVILLTGASRGIGAATARVLLSAGACVIGSYNSAQGDMTDLLNEYGPDRLLIVQANLTDINTAKALWDTAVAWKGTITAVVNNAGIMPEASVKDSDDNWHGAWSELMQVNVQAVADLCRFAILHFQENKSEGRIVNIASRAAHRGDQPEFMHYAASKGAVLSLTKSIARGFAHEKIYAWAIAPGWVKTEMAAIAYEPGNEYMLKDIPIGDAAPPEQVGNMIAFAISGLMDHATGSTLDINGASYVR